jgi:hypothetical protein
MCLGAERQNDTPNTFAPEGASRCRALASGLKGRAAGRKERLSEKVRGVKRREWAKVKEKLGRYAPAVSVTHWKYCGSRE